MTTPEQLSGAARTAREYYDSHDADIFYSKIWGGDDIHIGVYEHDEDTVADASRRTVEILANGFAHAHSAMRILDIGSGYGGADRYLARRFGCRVTGLNLSTVENRRARTLNAQHGLGDLIEVVDGSFESVPCDDQTFDVVWSQDAILHAENRQAVFAEVARVLKPGGLFTFTDPMQADECPANVLKPILERLSLSSLGSPRVYRAAASRVGLDQLDFRQMTEQLTLHYTRVKRATERERERGLQAVSADYIDRMLTGLDRWIEGGSRGHLVWGIFRFRKTPAA